MRNNKKNKWLPLYICIPVVILLILLRFGLYYIKSDGFSGIPALLPVLLLCFILFALSTSAFFAAWVYQDCRNRGDDPVLWALVTFIATPFIGLLLYFLRRPEIKRGCPACGHQISFRANYCEECGAHIENKEDYIMAARQGTHHLKLIVGGVVCMAVMLACLTGFIVRAAAGNGVNTDAASDERVWNWGAISMNYNSYADGVWKLDFKSASEGFIEQENMTVQDAGTQTLYADISCGTVPEGATLVMWLVQGNVSRSFDVTNLSEPFQYSLSEFENGKIHVRLQINGVEDTVSEIYIQ